MFPCVPASQAEFFQLFHEDGVEWFGRWTELNNVARTYAALATASTPTSDIYTPRTATTSSTSETSSSPNTTSRPGMSTTTPSSAQSYLSDLLSLPADRQFPPPLSLQILTHKSYRHVHIPRRSTSTSTGTSYSTTSPDPTPLPHSENWAASHNARLSFLGRRALASYFAMFVHSAVASAGIVDIRDLDFLRGKSLEERLAILRHDRNLGNMVGNPWRVDKFMRWDGNQVGSVSNFRSCSWHPFICSTHAPCLNPCFRLIFSLIVKSVCVPCPSICFCLSAEPNTYSSQNAMDTGASRIKGLTVQSILGGIFTQYGSPAAHRAFHLLILPHLSHQLRDPVLKERAEIIERDLVRQLGGTRILVE